MTTAAATTVVQVDFKYRPRPAPTVAATPRLPRVVKTLALAHRIEAAIAAGQLRDYADAARALGWTRARTSQVIALLQLAPAIQQAILDLRPTTGPEPVTERQLRSLTSEPNWQKQLAAWRTIDV